MNGSLQCDLVFQLADLKNNEIMKVNIRSPYIMSIPLMAPGSVENSRESKNKHEIYLEEGSFILKFPYYKNVRYANLLESNIVEVRSRKISTPTVKNEKAILQMDLCHHLND